MSFDLGSEGKFDALAGNHPGSRFLSNTLASVEGAAPFPGARCQSPAVAGLGCQDSTVSTGRLLCLGQDKTEAFLIQRLLPARGQAPREI